MTTRRRSWGRWLARPVSAAYRPEVTVGQRDVDDGRVQHAHRLGGRDGQRCHAKVAGVVPGAGTLHTDTPEQFAGALGTLAVGWTIGAVGAFALGTAGDRPDPGRVITVRV